MSYPTTLEDLMARVNELPDIPDIIGRTGCMFAITDDMWMSKDEQLVKDYFEAEKDPRVQDAVMEIDAELFAELCADRITAAPGKISGVWIDWCTIEQL